MTSTTSASVCKAHLKLGRDRILVILCNPTSTGICARRISRNAKETTKPKGAVLAQVEAVRRVLRQALQGCRAVRVQRNGSVYVVRAAELKLVVAGLNSTMRESHKEGAQ